MILNKKSSIYLTVMLVTFFVCNIGATYAFIPDDSYDYTTETWYFRSGTWTVNDQLGYQISTTQSSNATYVQSTDASQEDFTVGMWVQLVDSDGTISNVTTGVVGTATQASLTNGTLLNTTYALSSEQSLDVGDAIQIKIYHKIGSGSYTAKATFITDALDTNEIDNTTWSISYYVTVTEDAGTYYYRFYFGDSSKNSKIVNIQYSDLTAWERGQYYLSETDLIGFILTPYTFYVGQEIAFGIIFLIVMIPAYNRYRDIRPVILLFLLFGGVGGFLTLVIPAVGIQLSYFFMVIGVALMLYKLLR